MKRIILLIILSSLLIMTACTNTKQLNEIKPYTFDNGNFELGTLEHWTTYGEAFSDNMVSFQKRDPKGLEYRQEQQYFFHGGKNGLGKLTGYMISPSFKLKGNGILSFLMGAAENIDLTYVAIINEENEELIKIVNENFNDTDQMFRLYVDLSMHLGKTLRIMVVDLDDTDSSFNYVNVDDFILSFEGPYEPSSQVYKANQFIIDNEHKLNTRYRHTYHAMSRYNWANDPNGLIWYNDEFHLFYQHNPYQTFWGPMHWGHQTTKDFIKWEHQPVALAPDRPYDKNLGAFSGTAIVKDDHLILMYTSVSDGLQQQAKAYSVDGGITFQKDSKNPIITTLDLPTHANPSDFRDPKVFKHNDTYYIIIAGKTNNAGQLFLYKSPDLVSFEYVGDLINNNLPQNDSYHLLTGGIYECPDFFIIDGQHVLVASPMRLPKKDYDFENLHSVVYMIGSLDFDTGHWSFNEMAELDGGFDFYAAQTAKLPDDRTIMIAWMQMWDRTMPTSVDGWAGAFTLPRELSIKDGILYQKPIREIEHYRENRIAYSHIDLDDGVSLSLDGIIGNTIELDLELDVSQTERISIELFKGETNKTVLTYDKVNETLSLDRSLSGREIRGMESNQKTRTSYVKTVNGTLKLRIFLDISSIEIFINDGFKTMTSLVYPNSDDIQITFISEGGTGSIKNITKYDIVVQ